MTVKFGVCIPNFGRHASEKSITSTAIAAEEEGFHSVWTTDHVVVPERNSYPYGNLYETLSTLAYLSAVTKNVKLGTSVLVVPQRNPVVIAKQIATIDRLSGGRVIVGVGVGWLEDEFRYLRAEFGKRGRLCNEYIRLMRSLWRGERSFRGEQYSLEGVVFGPKPAQPGGPPIWVGGSSRAALERAALLGDGWHPVGVPPTLYKALVDEIRSMRGNDEFVKSVRLTVRLDGRAGTYKSPTGELRVMLGGSASDVIKQLEGYVEAGVEYVVVYFGDLAAGEYVRRLRVFSRDVAPSF